MKATLEPADVATNVLAPAHVIDNGVGPVLQATPLARCMIEALEEEHEGLFVEDAGAYYRIFASGVCRLRKEIVDEIAGRDVSFPRELEVILSSFTGKDEDERQRGRLVVRSRADAGCSRTCRTTVGVSSCGPATP